MISFLSSHKVHVILLWMQIVHGFTLKQFLPLPLVKIIGILECKWVCLIKKL